MSVSRVHVRLSKLRSLFAFTVIVRMCESQENLLVMMTWRSFPSETCVKVVPSTELAVVELANGHEPLLLYCFYHPDESLEPLLKLNLSLCENNKSTSLVVIGNFKLPELEWSGNWSAPINIGSQADHNIFCELLGNNFFSTLFLALCTLLVTSSICCWLIGQRSLTMF